jgi:hypothetical protein
MNFVAEILISWIQTGLLRTTPSRHLNRGSIHVLNLEDADDGE